MIITQKELMILSKSFGNLYKNDSPLESLMTRFDLKEKVLIIEYKYRSEEIDSTSLKISLKVFEGYLYQKLGIRFEMFNREWVIDSNTFEVRLELNLR